MDKRREIDEWMNEWMRKKKKKDKSVNRILSSKWYDNYEMYDLVEFVELKIENKRFLTVRVV